MLKHDIILLRESRTIVSPYDIRQGDNVLCPCCNGVVYTAYLVRLVSVLLQLLLQRSGLAVADLYRIDRVICFLQFDRPIAYVLAYGT